MRQNVYIYHTNITDKTRMQQTVAGDCWRPSKVGWHEQTPEVIADVHLVVYSFYVPLQVCDVVNYSLQSHDLHSHWWLWKSYQSIQQPLCIFLTATSATLASHCWRPVKSESSAVFHWQASLLLTTRLYITSYIRGPRGDTKAAARESRNCIMSKNVFQYGGWNSYTLQCGRWLWDDIPLNSPKRPPYWNSTSGFDFDHITAVDMSSAPVCKILSKSDHIRQKNDVMSI